MVKQKIMVDKKIWEKITHSGKHHAILFIDTVFKGYQAGIIGDFFQIKFNPTHYRQFDGARWWLKREIDAYLSALENKERNNPGFLLKKAEEYEKLNLDFLDWGKSYKGYDFSKDDNVRLMEIFNEFCRQLSKINALVYTAIMLDKFYTDKITQIIIKYESDFEKQKEYLNAIFSIDWGLEAHFERESLLDIAEMIKKSKSLTPEVKTLVDEHVKRFAHLSLVAFYGKPNDEKCVIAAAKNIAKKDIEHEKQELQRQRYNSKKVKEIIDMFHLNEDDVVKIKTLRKWTFIANNDDHYVMGAIYALRGLWTEIAKRFKISFDQFVEMRIEEIEVGLRKWPIDEKFKKDLIERQEASALVWEGNETVLIIGRELEEYRKKERVMEERFKDIKEVKGLPASPGKAVGKVQIIKDIRDIKKVKKGSILIAIYTYPAIVVAMEKANAIVTDQGGLLSHAAIVSRELHKPCVVGTIISTKVFKDGDLVEVDADKGIVRRIR